jgi:hypothetical protein
MQLTQEEMKAVLPAVEIGADFIYTRTWRQIAKSVLKDLKAERQPDPEDLKFVLTVVNSGRLTYVTYADQSDMVDRAFPVLEKLRR